MGIDYWSLTRDFSVGDCVQKFIPGRSGDVSPYCGRVLAVLPRIGFLDVQWPFGAERESPEDLVRVNPKIQQYMPPEVTFSYYPGAEVKRGSWSTMEVPQSFHRTLASLWHKGLDEVQAYDQLWHRFSSHTDDKVLRREVALFYHVGSKFGELFWDRVSRDKASMYWSSPGRQHRATKPEVESGRPACPRCKAPMRKTIYKMDEGARARLFACPSCLYLIKSADIFGPDGSPVNW